MCDLEEQKGGGGTVLTGEERPARHSHRQPASRSCCRAAFSLSGRGHTGNFQADSSLDSSGSVPLGQCPPLAPWLKSETKEDWFQGGQRLYHLRLSAKQCLPALPSSCPR